MKASKKIVGLFLALFILISGVCVGDDSADILDFLPAFVKRAKFGNAVAKPFFIVPGISTPVTITAYIPDTNLVPDSVQLKDGTTIIGNLTDTGNKVFSITNNFQGDSGGVIKLSISGTIGTVNKTIATLNISILSLPAVQTATQYNQNIDNIFSTLEAARDNFKALIDPTTNPQTFSVHLKQARDRLILVYAALEAIYRAETHSPSNYTRAAASFLGIGDYSQSAFDMADEQDAFRDDPYYATNPRYAKIREFMNTSDYCIGMNINNPQDRRDAAVLYQTKGPDSKLVKDIVPVTETTITKKLGEQFTDLAGNAIGPAYGGYSLFGTLIGKGINAGVHKIIDIFISNNGKKGFIVAEVQDGEALQVPAGSHDVLYSFKGVLDLDRAIARNIPVNQNLTTTVNIAPGEVKLCKFIVALLHGFNSASINNIGQVVGAGVSHTAYLWTPSIGFQDLGLLAGDDISYAYGINDNGQVVGTSLNQYGNPWHNYHAFLWTPSTGMQDLGSLGGGWAAANAINNSGQIVGVSSTSDVVSRHAFLWTPSNGMQDLGTLGGDYSEAMAINNSGQVVGQYRDTTGYHPFLWTPSSGMQDLGTLGGGNWGCAFGINDNGQVVGSSTASNGEYHAFLWTPSNGMQDLGTLGGISSIALSINNSGQVVGSYNGGAFLWTQSEGMIDLNTFNCNFPLSLWLIGANAINNIGQIMGDTSSPAGLSLMLTPIP